MNTCPSDCKAGGCGKGCDDQVACTVDICASDGGCAHISDLTACDDANFCTVDACGPAGCTHTPSLGNCDDSNACTVYDQCIAGACQPGAAKSCDDGNPCTTDTCAPESGCVHTGLAAGATCGSGICSTSGQCAVPPSGMVLVPGGTFWMGCNATKDKNCAADEKPQHKVTVSPFFMNTTEVTGSQYLACVDAGACKEPVVGCSGAAFVSINWDASAAMPKAGRAQHPVNCIDWDQARAYCQWLGAGHDLPTEAQWEFAARGSCEKNKSSATDPGCAATMRTHPWGEQTPTCDLAILNSSVGLDCGGQNTAAVGIVPGGASPYGLQDMSGNVSEWVRDAYASFGASAASDPFVAGTATDKRAVRGSSFKVAAIWPEARAGARKSATVTVAYSTVGFRCVAALP
jgi:formylglycine-generating enzyme required for sulfatase activity